MIKHDKIVFLVDRVQYTLDSIDWNASAHRQVADLFGVDKKTAQYAKKYYRNYWHTSALKIIHTYYTNKKEILELPNKSVGRFSWEEFNNNYKKFYKMKAKHFMSFLVQTIKNLATICGTHEDETTAIRRRLSKFITFKVK